jgi:hypothetical protein
VTAEQYEARSKGMVSVDDDTVRALAEGITVTGQDRNGHKRTRVMSGLGIAPWLQRTMGLRIREALGVRKADFMTRPDGTRYLHLCWQASENGRTLEPLKHRQAGDFRDVPVPDMVWDMVQAATGRPALPRPDCGTPYMPYSTARNRFKAITEHRGISGAHTHSAAPPVRQRGPRRQPARASQHQPGTRPRFGGDHAPLLHSRQQANAEQRIGAMMNARWTATPAPAAPKARPAARRRTAAHKRAAARRQHRQRQAGSLARASGQGGGAA